MENEKDELNITDLKAKVYAAARDGCYGNIISLLRCVDNESVKSDILNHHTEEDGHNATPLIIAAKNGKVNVINTLLNLFHDIVDLEQAGTVKFVRNSGEETCRGVTALWCAVAAELFDIAKLIVEKGANINHSSINNSSPLRVACLIGNLNIVQYLLKHDADLTIAYMNKNSCLMVACSRGNIPIVKCLIKKGADLDFEDEHGATALHIATQTGNVELVKLLIDNGATCKKNNFNVTPLMIAAAHGKVKVVYYFIGFLKNTKQEKTEALELLGAFFTDTGSYGMEQAYNYWKEALENRYQSNKGEMVDKVNVARNPVYDNRIECRTLGELEDIKTDYVALHMESLLIRERILGHDPTVSALVIRKGDTLYVEGMFDKCVNLWLHALKLNQNLDRPSYHVSRFAEMFNAMGMFGQSVDSDTLLEVFTYVIHEVQLDRKVLSKGEVSPQTDAIVKLYGDNIIFCVCIIISLLEMSLTKDNKQCLHKAIYDFIKLQPVLENGFTPLHISCQLKTPSIYSFNSKDVPPLPLLCKTLIDCGASVNAMDKMKNTPLHVTVKAMNTASNTDILKDTLVCLIENGAHVDMCNAEGKTPMEVATSDYAKSIICRNDNTNLKCLASRVIRRHRVPYNTCIPSSLQEYVELH